VTIQIIGTVDKQKMLLRSNAKVGDYIYVSGTLGDAGLALQYLYHKITLPESIATAVLQKLNRPQPQVALGQALAGHAHAAIDISDGLAQDLGHILTASGVGAVIDLEKLPLSESLTAVLDQASAQQLALTAGDDYQLCFTGPKGFEQAGNITCIGEITAQPGLRIYQKGVLFTGSASGFDHFGTTDLQSR
jgi:thiamine-monophosphate kinase